MRRSASVNECRPVGCCGVVVRVFAFAMLLGGGTMRGQSPDRPCFLEVAVYDPRGNRAEFSIAGLFVRDEAKRVDVLKYPITKDWFRVQAHRLYFKRTTLPSRLFEIALHNGSGREVRADLVIESCHGRLSLTYNEADNEQDAGPSFIDGRLTGCSFAGDWWVRTVPMLDRPVGSAAITEAYVEPNDGKFSVAVYFGVRYVVLVGRGKEVIKALAADVTRGGTTTHVGDVDVSGACRGK